MALYLSKYRNRGPQAHLGGPGGLAPRPGFGAGSPAMPAYGEAIVRAWAHAAGSALVRQTCIGAADGKAQRAWKGEACD